MIESVIWTDLYKLTMGQAAFHNYPEIDASYEFINRGRTAFPERFSYKLSEQVKRMSELRLQAGEREHLEEKTPYLQKDYLNWFANYQFDPSEVYIDQVGGELSVGIEGPWKRTIYWEVPLMALICELYHSEKGQVPDANYIARAVAKGRAMREVMAFLIDFATRRAFSSQVHRNSLGGLLEGAGRVKDGGVLLGTSNVALAMEFGLPASGTYAHEWVMAHAAMFGVEQANTKAMEVWADEYLGRAGKEAYPNLGTALTDTYTTDAFLQSFTAEIAQFYTYLRQDSGIPNIEGMKLINHLRKIGLDPKDKGIVFSDALNIEKAIVLHNLFKDITRVLFGIGTFISNDILGVDPLQIVIKAYGFTLPGGRRIPVCKLSDDRGKESGDPKAIAEAKAALGLN